MPTQEKLATVAELKERVARATGIYLADYKGLNVRDLGELRQKVRGLGAQMVVVKNRLLKLALEGTPAVGLSDHLKGPNAAIFCDQDALAPAKVMQEFAKTHEFLTWKGGLVEGALVDATGMARLADLPSKQEILAGVVGGIAGPISGFVYTLSGLVSDLVYTLQSVADQKQGTAA